MDDFKPDWYSVPGDTMKTCLAEQGITEAQFSTKMGLTPEQTTSLLEGEMEVDLDIGVRLSLVLGSTANFWMERDSQYRVGKARIEGENE